MSKMSLGLFEGVLVTKSLIRIGPLSLLPGQICGYLRGADHIDIYLQSGQTASIRSRLDGQRLTEQLDDWEQSMMLDLL